MVEETIQVSWNLSQSLIAEIGNLLHQASTHTLHEKYWLAFDCLKAAKLRFIHSLNPKERKEFEAQEKVITKYLKYHIMELEYLNPNMWHKIRNIIRLETDKYNTLVMDTLNKYGYLIPPKENHKLMF